MANGDDIEVVHWVNINEQLKAIGAQVKEIAGDLVALRRQHDLATAERGNQEWRIKELEAWRNQVPQQQRSNWNLGVNGCSSISFAISALASLFSALVAAAAVVVAIIALNHP